jgi:hypothetical protein
MITLKNVFFSFFYAINKVNFSRNFIKNFTSKYAGNKIIKLVKDYLQNYYI